MIDLRFMKRPEGPFIFQMKNFENSRFARELKKYIKQSSFQSWIEEGGRFQVPNLARTSLGLKLGIRIGIKYNIEYLKGLKMKRFLHTVLVLFTKMAILAILAYVLHILTLLPFLESCAALYSVHVLFMLFIQNYYAFIKGANYAARHGRLF